MSPTSPSLGRFAAKLGGGWKKYPDSLKLTAKAPEIGFPKRKVIFQPSIFRGELLVSGKLIPQMVVKNGDESHGTKVKNHLKQIQASLVPNFLYDPSSRLPLRNPLVEAWPSAQR